MVVASDGAICAYNKLIQRGKERAFGLEFPTFHLPVNIFGDTLKEESGIPFFERRENFSDLLSCRHIRRKGVFTKVWCREKGKLALQ